MTANLLAITSILAWLLNPTVPVDKLTPEPVTPNCKPPSIITPPTLIETSFPSNVGIAL